VSAPLLRRSLAALALLLVVPTTWFAPAATARPPTSEDLHPDTGPDPGTCEALRTCAPVVK
jgi:hypothetical protein